jgi:hypothetical protein
MGFLSCRRLHLRALLVAVSLVCLMGQSYVAIGCAVHDLEQCAQGGDCADAATHEDPCHPCCGSMSSGHVCAHGVMMSASSIQTAFAPQYALVLPRASMRADAQFIPLGTFRPPTSV